MELLRDSFFSPVIRIRIINCKHTDDVDAVERSTNIGTLDMLITSYYFPGNEVTSYFSGTKCACLYYKDKRVGTERLLLHKFELFLFGLSGRYSRDCKRVINNSLFLLKGFATF